MGSTSFKVQEFEPDRLKVRLDLSAPDAASWGWLRPADVKARVNVAHLFGEAGEQTPRRGRFEPDAGAAAIRALSPTTASRSAKRCPEPYQERLAAASTDDSGDAEFTSTCKRFVGRAYRLSILARAFEAEGGRNVAAQNSAIVSDAPYLVGVKPDGDLSFVQRGSSRAAQWLAVNQQLNPVAADNLTLDWVQRKYVSVLTQQGNGTFSYVSRLKEVVRDAEPGANRRRRQPIRRCRRRSPAISCWCCATQRAAS